jgi:hypothetical protein
MSNITFFERYFHIAKQKERSANNEKVLYYLNQ